MSLVLDRSPRTEDELWYLTQALWGHKIPRTKVCPEHDAPFDAFATAYFSREPQILIHGSRGLAGKSRTLSILGLTKAAVLGSDVNILGGSLNQSNNIHQTMRDAWDSKHAPKYLIQDDNMSLIKLRNGAKIRPLTASQKTVRGPHPPFLLLDEIDEMDQLILDAALGQPMEQENWRGEIIPAQTTMSSTWQYADKTFAEMYRRHKDEEMPIFTWCVGSGSLVRTARGEVPIEEVTTKDRVLTRSGFRQVKHVSFMGYKPTINLKVGGRNLRLTSDHRVATPDGWREAGALAADTMSSVGANPSVLRCELVSLTAVSSAGLVPVGSGLVDAVRDHFKVDNVDARPVAAQMIERHSDWYEPDYLLIDPPVRLDDTVLSLGLLDSVAVALTSRPVDAVGEHGDIVSPVWDIGVEGEHEFVAEGVLVHNCYRETSNPVDGWLREEFVAEKKRQIPAEMWRVEYELGEPSIGNRAFDSEMVEKTFSLPAPDENTTVKVAKDFEQYKFATYREDKDYVIAADWAKEQDFTVITVFDATHLPMERVYYLRMRRRPYPVMIEYFNRIMRAYNADAIHDATGLGNVVGDYLDTRARGFLMTGAKRDNMLSEYVNAVENDKVRSPRIQSAYKATLYASVEDLYSRGKEFHLPDEVCADALAWHLVNKRAVAAHPVVLPNSVDPNWFAKEMEHNTQNRKSPWVGEVVKKGEDYEFSLMV